MWPVPSVISDSSPIQYLHQAGLLKLLPTLFGKVDIPEAVAAELEEGRRRNVWLPDLAALPWVHTQPVRDRMLLPLVTHLGNGEKEVLALGIERPDGLLLLDDRGARQHAVALELKVTGTLGILLLAKEQGKLGTVRPVLDRLQALRFRLNPSARRRVRALAGEEP